MLAGHRTRNARIAPRDDLPAGARSPANALLHSHRPEPPHAPQQFLAREYASRVDGKRAQERELLVRQSQLGTANPGSARQRIDLERADPQPPAPGTVPAAAQQRADPGVELL